MNHCQQLEADLRALLASGDADLTRSNAYGDMYEVKGSLNGPNGKILNVVTVWIWLKANDEIRFVTLLPNKEATR